MKVVNGNIRIGIGIFAIIGIIRKTMTATFADLQGGRMKNYRILYEAIIEAESLDEALFSRVKLLEWEDLELIFIGEEDMMIMER